MMQPFLFLTPLEMFFFLIIVVLLILLVFFGNKIYRWSKF